MDRNGRPIFSSTRNEAERNERQRSQPSGATFDRSRRLATAANANSPLPTPPQMKLPAAFQSQCC